MAEFLMNKNNVAYSTKVGGARFAPNKNGVLKQAKDMNTFCFQIATDNIKPEYPMTRVVKAIPNKGLKEKWIEKTFYVEVPVKAQKEDIDMFLQRVGDFTVDFKEAVGYSVKGVAKMKRGDSIRYRGKEGEFDLIFGDKCGGSVTFAGDAGTIDRIELRSNIRIRKGAKNTKGLRRDSKGEVFDFYNSPEEDIAVVVNEMISSEVHTICRSDRFKVTITGIKKGSLTAKNKEDGNYDVTVIAKLLSV